MLGACSMSMTDDSPTTTSSISPAVEVRQPLPQSLAYSDAARIGQAASEALWQVDNGQGGEWVNTATGSSGTVQGDDVADGEKLSGACRLFNTIVTSFGGVHRYTGQVCRDGGGRAIVQIDPQGEAKAGRVS